MAFTSPELVRRHIDTFRVGDVPITGTHIVLAGTAPVQLPHRGLVAGTISVKAPRSRVLSSETVVLNDDWVSLTQSQLIDSAVVVANDTSLGHLYFPNVDVLVDVQNGRLRRVPSGAIASGQQVFVLYDYYFVYTQDDDYTVDHNSGTIARRSTGAIADGQTVTVDYHVSASVIPDQTIAGAIDEAADLVLALIDPRFHDQLLPGLVIGETHLAVAAVCRMQALTRLGDPTQGSAATQGDVRVWTDLAQSYDTSGRERLARYSTQVTGLSSARKG